MHTQVLRDNSTPASIVRNALLAAVSLFFNGLGLYLTIQANIGAGPWDVLNLGLSRTLGILYGTASIAVSLTILLIDVLMREPIGIAMFIDAVVVGKTVDLFNYIGLIPPCSSPVAGVLLMLVGRVILAYSQYFYMRAALGCGPRDSLLVGLARRAGKVPIGVINTAIFSTVTFVGWLLGGPVGLGTLICAFLSGPIMQTVFRSVHFDATSVRHQHLAETLKILFAGRKRHA